jgi:hypothetical protein
MERKIYISPPMILYCQNTAGGKYEKRTVYPAPDWSFAVWSRGQRLYWRRWDNHQFKPNEDDPLKLAFSDYNFFFPDHNHHNFSGGND